MHPLNGWQDSLKSRGWNKTMAGGSGPADTHTHTHTHTQTHSQWCPLLSNKGLWSERQRWLKSAWDIWWCWYGSLRLCMGLIMCLCLWVCVCVCVCYSTSLLECFPICFLCVFDRDERALCSHVCWQEVRHSCTRPQLVSVRILCSFASAHFCAVFFSLPLLRSKSGNRDCLFWFLYALSLHLHHPSPLAYALPHPWLVLWQGGNRACSPLTASRLIQPPCQSCTRLPEEDGELWFAFDLATN